MGEFIIDWTSNEIESCSDNINGHYRFVSAKENPNNKDLYNKLLYRKLKALTINKPNEKWHVKGYKGFSKGSMTIYLECPHLVVSTLTYDAKDHAPNKDLKMKWITSCVGCFKENMTGQNVQKPVEQYEIVIPDQNKITHAPIHQQSPISGTSGNINFKIIISKLLIISILLVCFKLL